MWAFTGGEHYDEGQSHWKNGCGRSRVLGSEKEDDLSTWGWRRRKRLWASVPFTLVCPSHWLAAEARQSPLLADRRIEVIPNGLSTEVYSPFPKDEAKRAWGVQPGAKTVLFPSLDPNGDRRKGFDLLMEALDQLRRSGHQIHLLVLGAGHPKPGLEFRFPTTFLGRLQDDQALRLAYSAADVVVVPSRQENLANTLMEAMACGVPTVAFRIGGNPDMIDHGSNGYLADPDDCGDLAHGISLCLGTER
ncbi:MAG TPA: glycosyltransferase, partial [Spirochaetia bacterium]|nr:glycosyltransferase [Spirochaetia bacterium]